MARMPRLLNRHARTNHGAGRVSGSSAVRVGTLAVEARIGAGTAFVAVEAGAARRTTAVVARTSLVLMFIVSLLRDCG
jgi:hypothetical protein